MASGPITSQKTEGRKVEAVTDFLFLDSKITADGDCIQEIKTHALWKKNYNKPREHIKKQRHHYTDKICLVKAMVFPVVKYGCESWIIMKAEWRIDAFELWC